MSEQAFATLGLDQLLDNGMAPGIVVANDKIRGQGEQLDVTCPIDGQRIVQVDMATASQVDTVVARSHAAFQSWRAVPAPRRGQLVRIIGEVAREWQAELAHLITLEAGKTTPEALGEVQEWIDVCDFAVGLSRQLYGLTIASERPDHRMMEQWHPLGPVGIITAFNFPMAPWGWNAMVALACGDTLVWKPSEQTPLSALACHRVVQEAIRRMDDDEVPADLSAVVIGAAAVGQALAADKRLPLIAATGSIPRGRKVGQTVAARLGRSVLELGGNNAIVVTPIADRELALKGAVFAAAGTAGQRCTTLRRLIVHRSVAAEFLGQLQTAYGSLPIGDPREEGKLVGPLIGPAALEAMENALAAAREQGGEVICGGQRVTDGVPAGGIYVEPAIVRIGAGAPIVQHETFAPILWVIEYDELDEAIDINNSVPQGFSSAIFTERMREAERFMSAVGSDCGIVNVNIGTSGAEIGGAFG